MLQRAFWSGLLVATTIALTGRADAQQAGAAAAGPVQVGVVTLHPQAVPITTQLPGRVDASQTADVRPQVSGVIKSIDFKAGQQVKPGDVLYEIDDAVYQAQVQVQAAAVQKAEAAVSSAQAQVTRDQELAKSSNISQSDLQTAQVTLAQATADVASAEASLKSAQINESFTSVTAPISGLISDSAVTQGALVTAAQTTALATVRLLDPSYVYLVETSANLLKLRAQFASGTLKGGPRTTGQAGVHLILEDGSAYPQAGSLTLADVVVSQTTGTFSLRATFPNPRRLLLPGMFVRATVDLGTEPSGYLVPQRAVTFDVTGAATAFFAENGKAVTHTLSTTQSIGNDWLVTAGITDGAQVIVDGLQKISNGSAVTPLEVTLDKNGVAQTATSGAAVSTAPAAAGAAATTQQRRRLPRLRHRRLRPVPAATSPAPPAAAATPAATPSTAAATPQRRDGSRCRDACSSSNTCRIDAGGRDAWFGACHGELARRCRNDCPVNPSGPVTWPTSARPRHRSPPAARWRASSSGGRSSPSCSPSSRCWAAGSASRCCRSRNTLRSRRPRSG